MAPTAEQRILARLREALPQAPYRLYPSVGWVAKADAQAPARDGETDLVIVHPEHGLLVVEVKGGRIRRDSAGRWWSGEHLLDPPPFRQAETSKHALRRKLTSLPGWPGAADELRMGHAVAFPDVGVRETRQRIELGPDASLELVLTSRTSPRPMRRGRRSGGRSTTGWAMGGAGRRCQIGSWSWSRSCWRRPSS